MLPVLVCYVSLHVANILGIKLPVEAGLSPGAVMAVRGAVCLLLLLLLHRGRWEAFVPQRPRFQIFRLFWAGLSLCLLFFSFRYVHGSTVAMLSRLDIAWLIILSALAGETRAASQKALAVAALAGAAAYAYWGGGGSESPVGYFLAFAATLGLSIGFLLLKQSSRGEAKAVTIGVPALALVGYGILTHVLGEGGLGTPGAWLLAVLSGGIMLGLYETTLWFYRRVSVAEAEMPTLLAALLVLPLERWLRGTEVSTDYVAFLLTLGAVLALILKWTEVTRWISKSNPFTLPESTSCSR